MRVNVENICCQFAVAAVIASNTSLPFSQPAEKLVNRPRAGHPRVRSSCASHGVRIASGNCNFFKARSQPRRDGVRFTCILPFRVSKAGT